MSEININEFTPTSNQIKGTGALYSHKVRIGTLKNSSSKWYCKEIKSPELAKIEILAQEFFRLIIPHQPETRIAKNFKTGTYYILSERIPGFRNLPKDKAERFRNQYYKGLGQVMVCSMFLQETDLKNGNVGIDRKKRVKKIDGNWCFSQERYPGDYKLTTRAIEALPNPIDFRTHNWLDLIKEGNKNQISNIIDIELSNSPQYRAEVNQALYKICLLPDIFIEAFVDTYITAGGQRFVDLLKSRRDELQVSALDNASFRAYLATPEAKKDAKNILLQMKQFKSADQFIINPEKHKDLAREFNKGLNFPIKICEPIILECHRLLDKINAYRMIPDDIFMDEALEHYRDEIKIQSTHPQKLSEIKDRLSLALNHVAGAKGVLKKINAHKLGPNDTLMDTTIHSLEVEITKNISQPEKILEMKPRIAALYSSICASEINSVKQAITTYRNDKGFFSIGKTEKADKIEIALYATPIEQRGTIISSSDANLVQEALATHRYPGSRGDVFKTKDGKIDNKRAPQLFKKLKVQYPSDNEVSNISESRNQMGDETRPLLEIR